MGIGLYPAYNPHVPAAKFDADGKTLAREADTLDEIAEELGLSPLTAFADRREVPENFQGDPDELDELLGEWTQWFSVRNGMKTVKGLREAISKDRSLARRLKRPQDVLDELEELQKSLSVAQLAKAKFRIELG
jgi:hypothetical protein